MHEQTNCDRCNKSFWSGVLSDKYSWKDGWVCYRCYGEVTGMEKL